MAYDLIGDIHGHSAPLTELLTKLDYQLVDGVYRHPDRQVIFLGDFIDRGPNQRDVINIVRPMIDGGSALSVMGNHEFNAIAWSTPDPDAPGKYLRERSDKNRKQTKAFLDKDQNKRYAIRVKWWTDKPKTYRDAFCGPASALPYIPDESIAPGAFSLTPR